MLWYLIMSVYSCSSNMLDAGINPGVCGHREQWVAMPSLEVCRQVRIVNPSSKCLSQDIDQPTKESK